MGEDKVKHQGWVASLSNGETIFEEPNVPGERSAWGKLQDRCANEEIWITQIQLQLYGNTLIGIPNADGYTAFYEQAQSWSIRDKVATYQGIGSVIGDWLVCIFTNESGHVWSDLRLLSNMRAHCQLKPKHARRKRRPRPLAPGSHERVQAIDTSEKDRQELSDEDFEKVAEWFRTHDLSHEADKQIAYLIYQEVGVTVAPDEIEDFRLAFWN